MIKKITFFVLVFSVLFLSSYVFAAITITNDALCCAGSVYGNSTSFTMYKSFGINSATVGAGSSSSFSVIGGICGYLSDAMGVFTAWYLAEGSTNGFDTFLLVQNPNSTAANVTITYMDQDGNTETQYETINANRRFTQKINDVSNMNNKSGVSTTVESTNGVGVIAERAMYWYDPSNTYWIGGHDSVGVVE